MLAACNDKESKVIIGYVADKSTDRILITDKKMEPILSGGFIDGISKQGIKEAYWVNIKNKKTRNDIQIGDKVKIQLDGPVLESFPMQATAKNVEKVNIK